MKEEMVCMYMWMGVHVELLEWRGNEGGVMDV